MLFSDDVLYYQSCPTATVELSSQLYSLHNGKTKNALNLLVQLDHSVSFYSFAVNGFFLI